jgi:putative flippase GtrA
MRNVFDVMAMKEGFKYGVLAFLGLRFLEHLNEKGIVHNKIFRGAYDYKKPADFAALMARWCSLSGTVLVYCHPGFPDAGLEKYDDVLEPRRKEYDFLSGAQFSGWLQTGAIALKKRPPSGYTRLFQITNQLRRFLFIGGINTAFGYAIYAACRLTLDIPYFLAVAVSWSLGVIFSYLTFRTFVFTEGDRSWRTFKKFLPTYVALLVFNELLLFILVGIAGWNDLIAQGVAVIGCAVLSFIINRIFVFK